MMVHYSIAQSTDHNEINMYDYSYFGLDFQIEKADKGLSGGSSSNGEEGTTRSVASSSNLKKDGNSDNDKQEVGLVA